MTTVIYIREVRPNQPIGFRHSHRPVLHFPGTRCPHYAPVGTAGLSGRVGTDSDLPQWQAASEALLLVSRGGPTMMARIGVMRALNRHVVRVFNPDRKDTHWGKRKLKRDQ
jgi:hypothetical protein